MEKKLTVPDFRMTLTQPQREAFDALRTAGQVTFTVPATPNAAASPAPAVLKPEASDVAPRRAANDLSAMSIAELQSYAAVMNAVAAHHRGELPVAVADPASTEFQNRLDAAFGSEQKTELGVVFNERTGTQTFGAQIPITSAPKQAPRRMQTPPYVAPAPSPSPKVSREFESRLDAAFSDGKIAEGVTFNPATGVQSFGVVSK